MKRADDVLNQIKNGIRNNGGHSEGNIPTSSSGSPSACSICGMSGSSNICDGLGVFRYDVPIEDPRFGKLFRCPNNPVDQDTEHQKRLRRLSNLEAFVDKNFDNFEIRDDSLGFAVRRCRRFAATPDGWILLEGTYGCGKTHLAAAIGNERLKHGDTVLFITSPDLLDHLRAGYSSDTDQSYDQTFDRVRNAAVLILDDLGVENPSPWAQEKLFQLLNYRYMNRMATVITTNQNIDRLDPRIRSRLLDAERTSRLPITAPDFRSGTQRESDTLRSALRLHPDKLFERFDTENLVTPDERRNLSMVLQHAQAFAANPHGAWFVLSGDYGAGKTHLAAAIGNAWLERGLIDGQDVMFISVPELIDYLKMTFNKDVDQGFDERFQQVRTVPYLILDDFGMESRSDWVRERMFQIIDYRYVTRLPTVISSSKPIEKLDDRVVTRLLDDRIAEVFEIVARPYSMRRRQLR